MSYNIRSDGANLLKIESLNMNLVFTRLDETSGVVSWNIPTPAAGCTAESQAYNGIVIVVDNIPHNGQKQIVDGALYEGDNTANRELHAGDKIGTALVLGAFYNNTTTTSITITDLDPTSQYFISAFPTDSSLRYYNEGIHAYSQQIQQDPIGTNSSIQTIKLRQTDGTIGVKEDTLTGLAIGEDYTFMLSLGGVIPQPRQRLLPHQCSTGSTKYTVTVNGTNAQTFGELVAELNRQFGLLWNYPAGATSPGTGSFVYDTTLNALFVWNGTHYDQIDVITFPVQPNNISDGSYWVSAPGIIQLRTNNAWVPQLCISNPTNPTTPSAQTTVWFTGATAYLWNGTTWCDTILHIVAIDPALPIVMNGGEFWVNGSRISKWDTNLSMWLDLTDHVVSSQTDPRSLATGTFWYNPSTSETKQLNIPVLGWNSITSTVRITSTAPSNPGVGIVWLNFDTVEASVWNGTSWDVFDLIIHSNEPTVQNSCSLWWNEIDTVFVWNKLTSSWVAANTFVQANDPTITENVIDDSLWFDGTLMHKRVGNCWIQQQFTLSPTDPTVLVDGTIWYNGTNYFVRAGTNWTQIYPIVSSTNPASLPTGSHWFNPITSTLYTWNGSSWQTTAYTVNKNLPAVNSGWYDTINNIPKIWNGVNWVEKNGVAKTYLNCNGHLVFVDTTFTGSDSFISIDGRYITDTYSGMLVVSVQDVGTLWPALTTVQKTYTDPVPGDDGQETVPSYARVGVGTDGTNDERISLMNDIRLELGLGNVDVELTPAQLDLCITKAIEVLRAYSSIAYRRGFFFMHVAGETQKYKLNAKNQNFDKIVNVIGVYRMTSAFVSSAHGAGIYGQIVLQHLYNMGTFDLLSYHMMSDYVKNMEQLFAAKVTFTWDESSRELMLHHRFPYTERQVLIEAAVERTEQSIMQDRRCRPWLRKYTLALAKNILAETRGKFSTIPGPNGGTTLNASDLRQSATELIESCMLDIEMGVVDNYEEWGAGTSITIG